MDSIDAAFLHELLVTPSPSGYEQSVQEVVRRYARRVTEHVSTDMHGNVIAAINPQGSPRIMLAAHADQIGLIVKHIDDRGFIWVQAIGGWDPQVLLGQSVQVWTESGPLSGLIARKPIHLLSQEERKTAPEIKQLWIDLGCETADQVRQQVRPGDPVTLRLGECYLPSGAIISPGLDDKAGVWTIFAALRQAAALQPQAAIFAVSTVQEEIGLRGVQTSAYRVQPQVGLVVDVTHATDCPTVDENQYGRVRLGQGPVLYRGPNVNPRVFSRLQELAQHYSLPVQLNALGTAANNDAAELQLSREGVAVGLVCLPNRYMHSPVEMVSQRDMEQAAELIARFCAQLTSNDDFTP